ncbi:MAG: hypothetical protein FJ279_15765 [Planctomycetes bacterium]|nr:hypothetical protein [Planctomycetota bacterium]
MKLGFCKAWLPTLVGLALAASSVAAQEAPSDSGLGVSLTPSFRYISVKGDKGAFQEHWWAREGWAGGLEDFSFEKKIGGSTLKIEGNTLIEEQDHKLRISLTKPDFGYVRGGFSNYRKYFDDTGGYYALFRQPHVRSQDLDRGLSMDIGNIYLEAGLTLPNLPKLEVGYERQYKQGHKSMVEWGSVTQAGIPGPGLPAGTVSRKIYPASKKVDESVDIFKLNVEHDIKDITFRDAFRFEHYNNRTTREDDSVRTYTFAGFPALPTFAVPAPYKNVTVKEKFGHNLLSNTFTMESQPHEKVYWSAGYLYSKLWGTADYWMDTQPYRSGRDKRWYTTEVDLDEKSHVINLGLMLGPFANLTPYGGVQLEKTGSEADQESIMQERAPAPAGVWPDEAPHVRVKTSDDRVSAESHAGLRYTGLPFTSLYAEGRWRREENTLFERSLEEDTLAMGAEAWQRQTDGDIWRQDYTIGFNTAPFRRVTWGGRYTWRNRHNDYKHDLDEAGGTTGLGSYSAFINKQTLDTNELSTNLTIRPFDRVTVVGKYQYADTRIHTTTQRNEVLNADGLRTADYTSHRYSLSTTWQATNKLYLTGMVSYQNTQTETATNGSNSVRPYEGNVLSLGAGLGYAFNEKTDVKANYVFSHADTFYNNGYAIKAPAGWVATDFGLPMGTQYQQHGLTTTLTHKLTKYMTAGLRYGFYFYENAANRHVDDYTAHLIGGFMNFKF